MVHISDCFLCAENENCPDVIVYFLLYLNKDFCLVAISSICPVVRGLTIGGTTSILVRFKSCCVLGIFPCYHRKADVFCVHRVLG